MKELKFEGFSDDTFACMGHDVDVDMDTCASRRPVHMRVKANDGDILVTGQYNAPPANAAGWTVSVGPFDEDMPDWPMRMVPGSRGYSPRLVIEAPDDVEVSLFDPERP